LMTETVVPACDPAFKRKHKLLRPADLLSVPLLHVSTRADAWKQWFGAKGVPVQDVPGMLVDQFAMAAQAATAGLGVALLPRFLMEPEFSGGQLVPAIARGEVESASRYYMVWPANRATYPPVQAFAAWLRREVTKTS
jgi:LysR family glycine cleavage system transcriptional activator